MRAEETKGALEESFVNSSVQKIVQSKKCSSVPLPVPTRSSNQLSDSQEQATKRVEEERKKEPSKEKNRPVAFAAVVGPVSPIPAREPEEKKASVQVTVESRSRTKVNTLHED